MKVSAKEFRDLIETLVQRGDIEVVPATTPGRASVMYRSVEGVKEG